MSAERIGAFEKGLVAHGIFARDVRDGAHEAFHALSCRAFRCVTQREELASRLEATFDGNALWTNELQARAVEQIVCDRLGYRLRIPTEKWVVASMMEAAHFKLPHGNYTNAIDYVVEFRDSKLGKSAADLVMAWMLGRSTRSSASPRR